MLEGLIVLAAVQRLRLVPKLDPIVTTHDRKEAGVHRRLERWIVHLPLCALVDSGVDALPRRLLVIVHVVLGVGDDSLRLNPGDDGADQLCAEIRVLPRKVPAPPNKTLDRKQMTARVLKDVWRE